MPPRLFLCGLAFWGTTALLITALRTAESPSPSFLKVLCAAFLIMAVFFVVVLKKRSSLWRLIICFCFLGIVIGLAHATSMTSISSELMASSITEGTLSLKEDARENRFGNQALCDLVTSDGDRYRVLAQFPQRVETDRNFHFGDSFHAHFKIVDPAYSTSDSCWKRGAVAKVQVASFEPSEHISLFDGLYAIRNNAINAFEKYISQGIDNDSIALMEGLSCGYRVRLFDSDLYSSIKRDGLAHLVAVSGAHLVTVMTIALAGFNIVKLQRKLVVLLLTSVVVAYLALAAFPISAIRSAIMSIVGIASVVSSRRSSSLNSLGLCIIAIVLSDPASSLSISLLLSFASTAGIVFFASYFQYVIDAIQLPLPRFLKETLSLTIAANIICMPISVALFSQLPLVSVFANMVTAPLFPVLCVASLAVGLSATVFPSAFVPLITIATPVFNLFVHIVEFAASIPYSSIPLSIPMWAGFSVSLLSCTLLWITWPRIKGGLVAFSVLAFMLIVGVSLGILTATTGTRIVMLDVGQGDAILLQSKGRNLLIDTGNQDSMLREALARNMVFKLDGVVISHSDDDHYGSLLSLASCITVDRVLLANDTAHCPCDSCKQLLQSAETCSPEIAYMQIDDKIEFGDFSLKVVWPSEFTDEGGNTDSLCIVAEADVNDDGEADAVALFTGDAEIQNLEVIAKREDLYAIDILKVPHHGSKTGTNDKIATRLQPKVSLVSCGANNRYGHPHKEVVAALTKAGSIIYRTDDQGDVSCKIKADTLLITTQR